MVTVQVQNDYFFICLVGLLSVFIVVALLTFFGELLLLKCKGFKTRAKIGYIVVTQSWVFCLFLNNLNPNNAISMALGGQITQIASIIFSLLVTICFLYFLRKNKVFNSDKQLEKP